MYGTQYLNIVVGSLETPHVSYLYDCQPLKCASNSKTIAQAVDDTVRNLGINRSFFCLLLSDAAKYMIAAGMTLKSVSQAVSRDVRSTFIAQLCYENQISL